MCFLLSAQRVSHPNPCSLLYFCWKVNGIKLFRFSLLQFFWHHTVPWTTWVLLIAINYFFNDYSCGCFISFCSDLLFTITDIFSDSDLDAVQSIQSLTFFLQISEFDHGWLSVIFNSHLSLCPARTETSVLHLNAYCLYKRNQKQKGAKRCKVRIAKCHARTLYGSKL